MGRTVTVEETLKLRDVTTNDATSEQHGLCPKLSGDATEYLDGSGSFSTPAGGATGPTGPTGGTGGLVLLEEHTASDSPNLQFTDWYSSDYDTYQIEIVNLVPATNNDTLNLNLSTNGGESYDTGTNYDNAYAYAYPGSGADGGGSTGNTSFGFGNIANTTGWSFNASFKMYGPGSGAFTLLNGQVVYNNAAISNILMQLIGMCYANAAAVNAFQFAFAGGNIVSGTVRIYGLAKS